MSRQLCGQLGLKHIWTRILSVYGPYDGERTMLSSAVREFASSRQTHFTKGEQLWDYLYSGDAAEILYLLGLNGKADKTYVLGSGTARPLREYIETLAKKWALQRILVLGMFSMQTNK